MARRIVTPDRRRGSHIAPQVVALRNLNIYDARFYDNARLRWMRRVVRIGLRRARCGA